MPFQSNSRKTTRGTKGWCVPKSRCGSKCVGSNCPAVDMDYYHVSMKRPRIGITRDSTGPNGAPDTSYVHYATSVEKAGGEPVPIYYGEDLSGIGGLLKQIDGLLFSGGDDMDPQIYGQQWHPKAKRMDPVRQKFEMVLLAEGEKRRLPILGICLGVQLMNVHRGGSLIQFLPEFDRKQPLEHRKLEATMRRHSVRIEADSILAHAIGKTEINANTYHKQAIDRPGKGLRVTAHAPDGIIEAIEDSLYPLFVGVQWHPERLHEECEHLAIFKLLVEKAAKLQSLTP